jgi:hypothetical protein
MSTPRGHVLFCDDVRQENTGKFTYIGIYTNGMVLHGDMPAVLPTFCAVITYIERPGETNDPVRIVIESPWDEPDYPFGVIEFPVEPFRSQPVPDDVDDPQMSAGLVFRSPGPFVVPKLGTMTVYAEVGTRKYRLGRLPITREPDTAEMTDSAETAETTH